MMNFEIKHRWTNAVLFSFEADDLREAVVQAVKSGADLSDADLSDAYLRGANLSNADLNGANLSNAKLIGANLRDADLRGADLSGADLSGAYLEGANLRDADLRDADLRGANLSGADLSDASLVYFKTDFFDILLRAPKEITGLRQSLIDGKVDGSIYQGACACLLGTIANIRGCEFNTIGNGITPNASRPAEQWFAMIKPDHTPENNQASKLAVKWIDEFTQLLELAKN